MNLGVAHVDGKLELDGLGENQLEDVLVELPVDMCLVVAVEEHPPASSSPTTDDHLVEPVHVVCCHEVLSLVDEDGVELRAIGHVCERKDCDVSLADQGLEVVGETRRSEGDQHRPALVCLLLGSFDQGERLAGAGAAHDEESRVARQPLQIPRLAFGRPVLLLENCAALGIDAGHRENSPNRRLRMSTTRARLAFGLRGWGVARRCRPVLSRCLRASCPVCDSQCVGCQPTASARSSTSGVMTACWSAYQPRPSS